MSSTPCAFQNRTIMHHSDDRVTVYHGRPEPLTLCGYHALPAWLPDVFAWLNRTQPHQWPTS